MVRQYMIYHRPQDRLVAYDVVRNEQSAPRHPGDHRFVALLVDLLFCIDKAERNVVEVAKVLTRIAVDEINDVLHARDRERLPRQRRATIAHGYLTLSLLPKIFETAIAIDDVRMGVNYGLNRVRFPAPVLVGSRLRGHLRLLAYDALPDGAQLTTEVTIEREGGDKPVCVAQALSRRYTSTRP